MALRSPITMATRPHPPMRYPVWWPSGTTLYTYFLKRWLYCSHQCLASGYPSRTRPCLMMPVCEDEIINLNTLINRFVSRCIFRPKCNRINFTGSNLGSFTITFTPNNLCLDPATADINVSPGHHLHLGDASLCSADPLLDLSTLADPSYPNGTWTGPGYLEVFWSCQSKWQCSTHLYTRLWLRQYSNHDYQVTPAEIPFPIPTSCVWRCGTISLFPAARSFISQRNMERWWCIGHKLWSYRF